MCPRCNERPRVSKASYCRPCGAAYQRERNKGQHGTARVCSECEKAFTGRGSSQLCSPCRYSPTRNRECVRCKKSSAWPGRVAACLECRRYEARQNYTIEQSRCRKAELKYGLPIGGFKKLLEDQDFKCACCAGDLDLAGTYSVHVDHDHKCCAGGRTNSRPACGNCVRGILCRHCNVMLGNARDSVETLRAGIDYLLRSGR